VWLVFVGLLAIATALLLTCARTVAAMNTARRDATIRHLQTMFAPGMQAVQNDPRQFLVWYPLAQVSRRVFPDAFTTLDHAWGSAFPFSRDQVQDAHARWTADWLAWERAHDGEYTVKTVSLQEELARAGETATPMGRARLAALDREKLERYQDRYQQYIRTAKALQALIEDAPKRGATMS